MLTFTVVTPFDVVERPFYTPVEEPPLWFKPVEIGQASVLRATYTYHFLSDCGHSSLLLRGLLPLHCDDQDLLLLPHALLQLSYQLNIFGFGLFSNY